MLTVVVVVLAARAPHPPSLLSPAPPPLPPADPSSKTASADFFHRREFTFTLEHEVFVRYLCFRDAEELAKAVMSRQPERIEIGPVYTARPSLRATLPADKFKPVERELIFDIDLNDYDDVRTCCTGAKICGRCWAFINVAIRVLDAVLRADFGFQHVLFVYSGRRGMHCWVADEAARALTNEQRAGVVEYINCRSGDASDRDGAGAAVPPGADAAKYAHVTNFNRVLNAMTAPLLPAFARAVEDLEPRFVELVAGAAGQGLLETPERWAKVLDCIPEKISVVQGDVVHNLKATLADAWPAAKSPEQRWRQLTGTVQKMAEINSGAGKQHSFALARTLEKLVPALVLAFAYPRLDVEVSKHRNHLLKAPFCVHPKTGRVCVPLTAAGADAFDPLAVPTVAQLMREGHEWVRAHPEEAAADAEGGGPGAAAARAAAGGARLDSPLVRHTSLQPYLDIFDGFLRELYATLRAARRERAEAAAAATGEW